MQQWKLCVESGNELNIYQYEEDFHIRRLGKLKIRFEKKKLFFFIKH